jgi:N-acyl homoserine lactone hydrolase
MRLYLLRLGDYLESESPVAGYLIQADDGTNVLVDTGYPRELIGVVEEPFAEGRIALRITEDQFVVNQLARIGVSPGEVRYVVVTHLDADHAGALDEFPSAEFVIQRRQLEARDEPRFQHVRSHWDVPTLRFVVIDGDTTLLPGIALLDTSGHVPGHQSVLVRLPVTGPVILAIDAMPDRRCVDPDLRPITPYDEDEAGVRASTRKLVELAKREQAAFIVLGHDGLQWSRLKTLPDYYD